MRQKGVLKKKYSDDRKTKPELKFRLLSRAGVVKEAVNMHIKRTEGLVVLDMGTAEGRTLRALNELLSGKNYFVGVEYSEELIKSVSFLPKNIKLIRGDVNSLPIRLNINYFDIVSALAVLEHVKYPKVVALEAFNILKPGGLFVATCPVPHWDFISSRLGLLDQDHHETKIDKKTMKRIVQDVGFEILEYKKFMWAPISFLPYLNIWISAVFAAKCDQFIRFLKIFNWLFVNQVIIGRKP